MAGESNKDVDIAEKSDNQPAERRKEIGLMSRIWNGLFGSQDDDFGRRLERISKEEASILSRIRRRSHSSGRIRLHLILFSVVLEFIAVGYAILTATSVENWKNRAFHVLPMFLLPVVSSVTYTALANFIKMCERKDQKTLEDLRAEKQSKIDELKEKTNYYITQQLIQKYDTDPAAKAAAATVLASKLGADSGLKVYLGDDSHHHPTTGKSNDAESIQSDGLRRRKQPQPRSRSAGSSPVTLSPDPALLQQIGDEIAEHDQPVYVDHYQQEQGSDPYTGNWLARIAALLVGEDPTQSYALICGNCHIHNGLATKEDFPYLTYICPHCRAVNGPRKKDSRISVSSSPRAASLLTEDNDKTVSNVNGSPTEGTLESNDNEQRPLSLTTEGIDDEDKNGQAPTSEDKES